MAIVLMIVRLWVFQVVVEGDTITPSLLPFLGVKIIRKTRGSASLCQYIQSNVTCIFTTQGEYVGCDQLWIYLAFHLTLLVHAANLCTSSLASKSSTS